MKIDRHNYEECFILYMDNELGNDDRRMVEEFVQKNPDLKEELDILLQYKMVPDAAIVFENKSQLIKQENYSPVNLANYEEWLLLYMDNELDAEQRTAVDQFIANHPSAKEELAVLLKTKLQPEKIIFAGKESLCRREEKVRLIPVRWFRIAAAAVLILFAGITAVVLLSKKSSSGIEVAKVSDNGQKINTENPVVINLPEVADNVKQDAAPNSRKTNNDVAVKHNSPVKQKLQNNLPVPVKKEEPVLTINKERPTNNLPQPLNNPILNDASNKGDGIVNNNYKEISKPLITNPTVTTTTAQPSNVVYRPTSDDVDLNQSAGKKNKLRGFFRKVTRTFEKNTNINATDDDRVLIGGLAIKLK